MGCVCGHWRLAGPPQVLSETHNEITDTQQTRVTITKLQTLSEAEQNALIPYDENDPPSTKISKIMERWQMNRSNLKQFMKDLKFNTFLTQSVIECLPTDNTIAYQSVDDVIVTLTQNGLDVSPFMQYWRVKQYVTGDEIIRRHLNYLFEFQRWKVSEQISYVTDDDLEMMEPYSPLINTHQLIGGRVNKSDILVVLEPRWYDPSDTRQTVRSNRPTTPSRQPNTSKQLLQNKVKLPRNFENASHVGTQASSHSGGRSRVRAADQQTRKTTNKFAHWRHKLSLINNSETSQHTAQNIKPIVKSPKSEITYFEVKLKEIKHFITLQAYSASAEICRQWLSTQDPDHEPILYHDNKAKHNRFYFCLQTDRTTAMLSISELVLRANDALSSLSLLYSTIHDAVEAKSDVSDFLFNRRHVLSMQFINSNYISVGGGIAKYWGDIDDSRSVLKRVLSAVQCAALGSVFMYPKDYAARLKWNKGDKVMMFIQSIEKWCPGVIVRVINDEDIEVRYKVLSAPPIPESGPIAEEVPGAVRFNLGPPTMDATKSYDSIKTVSFTESKSPTPPVVVPPPLVTPQSPAEKGKSYLNILEQLKNSLDIDFSENGTNIELTIVNRYDRDFIRPWFSRNDNIGSSKRNVALRPSGGGLIDEETGLGNRNRLDDRLTNICNDDCLLNATGEFVTQGAAGDQPGEMVHEESEHKDRDDISMMNKKRSSTLKVHPKNTHPIALMFMEVDQLCERNFLEHNFRGTVVDNQIFAGGHHTRQHTGQTTPGERKHIPHQTSMTPGAPQLQSTLSNNLANNGGGYSKLDHDFVAVSIGELLHDLYKGFNEEHCVPGGGIADSGVLQPQSNSKSSALLLDGRKNTIDPYLDVRRSVVGTDKIRGHSFCTQPRNVNNPNKPTNAFDNFGIQSEAFRHSTHQFALILHNTNVPKSLIVTRYVQKQLRELCASKAEFQHNTEYLTLSISIANLHYSEHGNEIMDSATEWYSRCDDALKHIRAEGGHGVCHADVLLHTNFTQQSVWDINHNNIISNDNDANPDKNGTIPEMPGAAASEIVSQPGAPNAGPQLQTDENVGGVGISKQQTVAWLEGRDDRKYTFV